MTSPRRFDPAEVSGHDAGASDAEVAEATLAARALEAAMPASVASVSPDLAEQIMGAIRREPEPRAIGILSTLRQRPSPAGIVDSVAVAWRRFLGAGSAALRASALAYVALVLVLSVSLSGIVAYSAAGALGLLPLPSVGPDATQLVASPRPLLSPAPTEVESPEPSDTAEPSETPEPSDDAGAAGSGGSASPRPSHGEDNSGSEANDTPQPSGDN